jgi:hypothetical protein
LDTGHKRVYRHLLRTAFVVVSNTPEFNRLFLNRRTWEHGDILEQLLGRLELLRLLRVPGVAQAAELLYFDPSQKTLHKRGAMSTKETRGDFRNRFVTRIKQLSRTYDVYAMDGQQIIELLGEEFSSWLRPQAAAQSEGR